MLLLFAIVLIAEDRSRSDRKLAFTMIAFWGVTGLVFIVAAVLEDDSIEYAGFLPVVVVPGVWSFFAIKRRDWISAWARLATSTAALGIIWTFMTYLFHSGTRIGIFVTYASLGMLAIAPWWLKGRWRQILIGKGEPATPIQFQIWHLISATTLVAAVYGYYRYVVPVLGE
ncbi:MAG: hypothetical protein AB8B91_09225 [Rubripirellula sp.]